MTESELIEAGFTPNTDKDGNKISYHPEGCTFNLTKANVTISTTDLYPYLWIMEKDKPQTNTLISTKITVDRIITALKFNCIDDFKFLGND